MFCYVAAQTGINSFFINYVTESDLQVNNTTAAIYGSFGGMGLFMLGRFGKLADESGAGGEVIVLLCRRRFCVHGYCDRQLGMAVGWRTIHLLPFESIMFPTLFAFVHCAVRTSHQKSLFVPDYGYRRSRCPILMGLIGENNMAIGFIVPLICFLVIGIYAIVYKG